jgi:hypothetical protein
LSLVLGRFHIDGVGLIGVCYIEVAGLKLELGLGFAEVAGPEAERADPAGEGEKGERGGEGGEGRRMGRVGRVGRAKG